MPLIVLMRVAIIGDASNHHTWKIVQGSRGLHLEAEHPMLLRQIIPLLGILDHDLSRCYCASVYNDK